MAIFSNELPAKQRPKNNENNPYQNSNAVQAKWHTPVIPALVGSRQKDHEFKACLEYIVGHCLISP